MDKIYAFKFEKIFSEFETISKYRNIIDVGKRSRPRAPVCTEAQIFIYPKKNMYLYLIPACILFSCQE